MASSSGHGISAVLGGDGRSSSSSASPNDSLSLIYGRLADLEREKHSSLSVLDRVALKYNVGSIPEADRKLIEQSAKELFDALSTQVDNEQQRVCNSTEFISSVEKLLHAAVAEKDAVDKRVQVAIQSATANDEYFARLSGDMSKLQESVQLLIKQTDDMSQLCRNLQTLEKEKSVRNEQLLVAERAKSQSMELECSKSLSSVMEKIRLEESDIDAKSCENNDLQQKIDQFRDHLELRRAKTQNEKRTRELMKKLEEAKLAQKLYADEQDRLKRNAVKSKIIHTKETISELEAQLKLYSDKFTEFDNTIARSTEVVEQLENKEKELISIVSKLKSEIQEWKVRSSQADANLISANDAKIGAEKNLLALRESILLSQKLCRELQLKRKEEKLREESAV